MKPRIYWPPAASVYGKSKLFCKILRLYARHTCLLLNASEHSNVKYFWNTTVSPECCLHCDDTVYTPESIMEVQTIDDECQSVETSICKKIPGWIFFFNIEYLYFAYDAVGENNAIVEIEINNKRCCHDERGK